ncbi:hypothetical protein HII13_000301 [Brettanomyces bruxellensis]|nr:hypothetical protein HII13_000301 [Brettanomyces bruxellensis]
MPEQRPVRIHDHRFAGRYFTTSDILLVLAALVSKRALERSLQYVFSSQFLPSFLAFFYAVYLIWDSGLQSPDYYVIPAADIESLPQLPAKDGPSSKAPLATDPKKPFKDEPAAESGSSADVSNNSAAVGSSSSPQPQKSAQPPSYEEATKAGNTPRVGDFKVQK